MPIKRLQIKIFLKYAIFLIDFHEIFFNSKQNIIFIFFKFKLKLVRLNSVGGVNTLLSKCILIRSDEWIYRLLINYYWSISFFLVSIVNLFYRENTFGNERPTILIIWFVSYPTNYSICHGITFTLEHCWNGQMANGCKFGEKLNPFICNMINILQAQWVQNRKSKWWCGRCYIIFVFKPM